MRLVVFSLMSLLVSGSSWAADLYVGADAGVTHTRVLSETRGSLGLYAGATLGDRFAAEFGWRRVGQDPHADIASASLLVRSNWSQRWSLYGRLGLGRLSSEIPNGNDAGRTRLLWGGGLHGGLTKNLAMRVDLQVVGSGTQHLGAGFMWRL